MGIENRYEEIDEYAVRLIRHKARQLVGHVGLTESDRQDLEQELTLDLLRRLSKYDSHRARRTTFIARIIEHKVVTLIKARTASIRDYRRCVCSLNDRVSGSRFERIETIDKDEYLRRTGKASHSPSKLRELRLDLESVIASLPPQLRSLCERLQNQTVTEIAKDTGISRSTIYDAIKKLREMFDDAGFGKYF